MNITKSNSKSVTYLGVHTLTTTLNLDNRANGLRVVTDTAEDSIVGRVRLITGDGRTYQFRTYHTCVVNRGEVAMVASQLADEAESYVTY